MNTIYPIQGFEIASVKAGIKYNDRLDLTVMRFPETSSVSGVFTKNRFCAAPVTIAKAHLERSPTHCLINTGYANAGTGQKGMDDALSVCAYLAEQQGVDVQQVLPFSTGVIGEYFKPERLMEGIDAAIDEFSEDHWAQAAKAIMTTDTRAKLRSVLVDIDGQQVAITGISKGAGMIKPNMATMLGFIATDAQVDQATLDQCLLQAANQSFNRITVDGDTSTNDACMLVATGLGMALEETSQLDIFQQALNQLMRDLALDIVRDGEGATKCIEISVSEGASAEDCLEVAYTVAHSP
ncbi:MAG: bifunctional glutamate N-acetyltransferase/amino-acid acetyltransferase ArgJ, partial [Pseudomonadota bacterium]|nr:bifunctional glutamate N-acetyltransferase/amino-acid acetyltransferase ArgJ [Pseudomonadota bacterium]